MKKNRFGLILWVALGLVLGLALSVSGFAQSSVPAVYINNQPAVPSGGVMMDEKGDCWVNSNYVPLTQADRDKLSNATINYQNFYQGNAFLDISAIAPLLNWQITAQGGSLTVTTPGYQPLTSVQTGNQPSVVSNVGNLQSQQKALGNTQSNSLPPYLYYFSGPEDGYPGPLSGGQFGGAQADFSGRR